MTGDYGINLVDLTLMYFRYSDAVDFRVFPN